MSRRSNLTPEERYQHRLAYRRDYNRANPERVRQWHKNYVLKKAAQILAEEQGGDQSDTRKEVAE